MRTRALLWIFAIGTTAVAGCSDEERLITEGSEIMLVALNEGHNGDLGGVSGADALCNSQAADAGRKETFFAFLSTDKKHVKDLVDPTLAGTAPVINARGEILAEAWNLLMEEGRWTSGIYLHAFSGKRVDESSGVEPNWTDADGWHGSSLGGLARPGFTCQNWTSGDATDVGAGGELDMRRILGQETHPCNTTLAVVCVGAVTRPSYGPCDTPGAPCTATDPCAIEPVCGPDLQCRATQMQICADELECTSDNCDGQGGCVFDVKPGYCLIGGTCYQDGDVDPSGCQTCDSSNNPNDWSPLSTACKAGNQCFQKGEIDPTGCLVCDPGQSADGWVPRSDPHCKIDNKCYETGDKHPQGCAECDPTASNVAWTPTGSNCLIDDTCYTSGATDASGCNACNPAISKTAWTPLSGAYCKIDGKCYQTGDKHPQGCAECDPTTSTVAWTPTGNDCLIDDTCYAPGAKDPSGCNECNPSISKIGWSPISGAFCKIDGVCYQTGEKHPQGCAECDPTVSALSWTPKGNDCLINNTCYPSGAKDPSGCNECNPTVSKTAWTPLSGAFCTIDSKCYQTGEKHPQGCAECNPTVSTTQWTLTSNDCLIDNVCYAPGAKQPDACGHCDPYKTQTAWSPLPGCFPIVVSALNEAHNGALGGTAGANALCAAQAAAAGLSGTFKAFLSSSTQDVKDLVTGTAATYPVVNTKDEPLYGSWTQIFSQSTWSTGKNVYAFDGKEVDENTGANPEWYDAQNWTGSTTAGLVSSGNTCQDWASASSSLTATSGEIDMSRLLGSSSQSCDKTLAVICVKTAP
jgi:hypothetical protein